MKTCIIEERKMKVCNMKKSQWKSAALQDHNIVWKKVQHEKSATRKIYDMKWVLHWRVQHENSVVWGKAAAKKGDVKRVKQETSQKWKSKLKQVQHGKCATVEDMQKKKDATWKEYNTKEGGPKKVQDKNPAWWNKWNTKIVQLERGETLKCNKEKVHEQSATWNNTKKMKHKKGLQRNTKKVAIWK